MLFYGLLDRELEGVDFYPSREAAREERSEILTDEPGWAKKLEVVLVDFSGAEVEVLHV